MYNNLRGVGLSLFYKEIKVNIDSFNKMNFSLETYCHHSYLDRIFSDKLDPMFKFIKRMKIDMDLVISKIERIVRKINSTDNVDTIVKHFKLGELMYYDFTSVHNNDTSFQFDTTTSLRGKTGVVGILIIKYLNTEYIPSAKFDGQYYTPTKFILSPEISHKEEIEELQNLSVIFSTSVILAARFLLLNRISSGIDSW